EVGGAEPAGGRAEVLVEDGSLAHVLHLGGHAREAVVLVDDLELAPIADLRRGGEAECTQLAAGRRQRGSDGEPALARAQLRIPAGAGLAGPNGERDRGR